jgi:hypothetical protein
MPTQPTPIGVFISTSQGGNFDLNPPVKPRWPGSTGNTFMINHIGKQGIPENGKMATFQVFRLNR